MVHSSSTAIAKAMQAETSETAEDAENAEEERDCKNQRLVFEDLLLHDAENAEEERDCKCVAEILRIERPAFASPISKWPHAFVMINARWKSLRRK